MNDNQITITVPGEIRKQLNNEAEAHGYSEALYITELLRSVFLTDNLIQTIPVKESTLNAMVKKIIKEADKASKGSIFFVNTYVSDEEWENLNSGEKKVLALQLSKHVKENPDRFSIVKLRGLNQYKVIKEKK